MKGQIYMQFDVLFPILDWNVQTLLLSLWEDLSLINKDVSYKAMDEMLEVDCHSQRCLK